MNVYYPNQTVTLEVTFINTQTEQPIAATDVTLRVLSADGTETNTTMAFTNPSTGVYLMNIIVSAPGIWKYRWNGSAINWTASFENTFKVLGTPFLVGYGFP